MPAIIDKNTWDKAQAVLNSHRKTNVRSGGNKIHRYSGLIKCADCGAILVAKNREWNGKQYVEYTCNSNHRYGKEYCTPHRIHEEQIDSVVKCEVMLLSQTILQQSDQYDKIIKNWERQKPKYKKRIQQFNERISVLKYQIENLLIERMEDKEHADIFNEMIKKREKEISELNTKITECLEYDNVCREKSTKLKSTADLLKDILTQPQISDADLRLLIEKIYVHQNADKSLELKIVFNGQFKNTEMVLIEESSIA